MIEGSLWTPHPSRLLQRTSVSWLLLAYTEYHQCNPHQKKYKKKCNLRAISLNSGVFESFAASRLLRTIGIRLTHLILLIRTLSG